MTLFIVGCAALVAVVLTMMVGPLMKKREALPPQRHEFDVALYREQLAEVDRDLAQGTLTSESAEAARLELQRRILAADSAKTDGQSAVKKGLAVPIGALVLVPFIAIGGYTAVGAPGTKDMPIASRDVDSEKGHVQVEQIEQMVKELSERLKKEPGNQEGWQMLGRSYRVMERFSEAAEAYGKAALLSNRDPAMLTEWGEMLMFAANGAVTDQTAGLFAEARKKDPANIKSWFYHAYAKAERGDLRGALNDWVELEASAPKDAPWLEQVREQIDEAAKQLGIDPASVTVAAKPAAAEATPQTPGPSKEQMAAAATMTPAERVAMVRSMVDQLAERLQENPDDLEGWLRLGRSRLQLEQVQEAKAAFKRAVDLKPKDPAILTEYASSILSASKNPQIVGDEMAAVLKRIQAVDPDDGNVLWYLGLREKQQGRPDGARKIWSTLLAKLTPDTVPWARLKAQLDGLK